MPQGIVLLLKVKAHFGRSTSCAVIAHGERPVAVTDGELIGRWYRMEGQGFRIVELSEGAGGPCLALVHVNNPGEVLMTVPLDPNISDTDMLRSLLGGYELDQMRTVGGRQ